VGWLRLHEPRGQSLALERTVEPEPIETEVIDVLFGDRLERDRERTAFHLEGDRAFSRRPGRRDGEEVDAPVAGVRATLPGAEARRVEAAGSGEVAEVHVRSQVLAPEVERDRLAVAAPAQHVIAFDLGGGHVAPDYLVEDERQADSVRDEIEA